MSANKNPTYDAFVKAGMEILVDGLLNGGIKGLRQAFQHTIMPWMHRINETGGFSKEPGHEGG